MDAEVPGVLRPTGGTKKFRRNCRLVAEDGAIAVTDRDGKTTRFTFDGTDNAPKELITYLGKEPFVIVDGRGRGLVRSPYLLWDADESADFCHKVQIVNGVNNVDPQPAALRADGVRLEEPGWLRRYVRSAPYVMVAGVALAPLGRAFDLPVWLMLPFLPWLLMYPVVRATGYFAPRRIGPSDIAFQKMLAEDAEKKARKTRKGKISKS